MTYAEKVEKLMKVRQLCLDYTGEDIFHAEINTAIDKTLAEIAKIVGVAPEAPAEEKKTGGMGGSCRCGQIVTYSLYSGKNATVQAKRTIEGQFPQWIFHGTVDGITYVSGVISGGVQKAQRLTDFILRGLDAAVGRVEWRREKKKAKRGKFVTPKPIADFVMANPPLSTDGQKEGK